MKTIALPVVTGLLAFLTPLASAQTNLAFNGVSTTTEGAVRLSWNSSSNEVYRIDCADELFDTNAETTVWRTLCDFYPSHGPSTFWLDTGNYNAEAPIPHPKYSPTRFYRIANRGTNDGESPYIVITSPTNNSVLTGLVSVSVVATSSLPILNVKLYVDGEEMDRSEDGTNFVINTCEWPNGSHVLFATAKAQSSFSGPSGYFPITIGRSVSTYVPVSFDNLISRVAFSEQFFEPSLGQTQRVTASFGANVDWTLQITDQTTNVVRTATGTGTSLTFNWDGTGSGGTNIPDGVYYFNITADTNGLPSQASDPLEEDALFEGLTITDDGTVVPISLEQAVALGMDYYYVPTPPYPPVEIGGQWFTWEEVYGPQPATKVPITLEDVVTLAAIGAASVQPTPQAASGASSQSTTAPTRPPTAPVKNAQDTYAVGFYSFETPSTRNVPRNGLPVPSAVHLDGCSTCSQITFTHIPEANMSTVNMIQTMKKRGWKLGFQRFDDRLSVDSIRRADLGYGGGEIFTQSTVGIFIGHGSYGMEPDYTSGSSGSEQIYFASGNPNDGNGNDSWLRLCQFGFGGGLKWMAILACNSICDPNYQDMANHGAIPLKETHLLCGTASTAWLGENIAAYWGENMLSKKQKVTDAWFNAGRIQYGEAAPGSITNTVTFRVTGYPECMDDTIANNTAPTSPSPTPGNLVKLDSVVYP